MSIPSDAKIEPNISRVALNDILVLSVRESRFGFTDVSFLWSTSDVDVVSFYPSASSSTDKNPMIVPNKLGTSVISVIYTFVNPETGVNSTIIGSQVVSVTWEGLSFGGLTPSDSLEEDGTPSTDPPSFTQEPFNVKIANIRAREAPCAYWLGPTRDYVVKSVEDTGESETPSQSTEDYVTELGYLINEADAFYDNSLIGDIGTVQAVRSVPTRCMLSAALPWSQPPNNSAFPPCNGSKPYKGSVSQEADTVVGRCPYYQGAKVWNHVVDDHIGFKVGEGFSPLIAATHVQEVRLNSDNWDNYNFPKIIFDNRFTIDTEIWSWQDYVYDPITNEMNTEVLDVRKVYVDDLVSQIIVDPPIQTTTGTPVEGGPPNYPDLIKQLFDFASLVIDFPKREETNPFIIRNFTVDENKVEIFGHTSESKVTVYAVNTELAIKKQYELGIVPAREDIIDNSTPGIGLPSREYIDFLLANVPEAVYQTESSWDGRFVFGLTYASDEDGSVDEDNRIELLYSRNDDIQVNKIRVYLDTPNVVPIDTSSTMLYDTTYIKCRFLHGWVYQTRFNGENDNSDSKFNEFEADFRVQLASGFESIGDVHIASPDLASIYATYKKSVIEGEYPKQEKYYLQLDDKITTVDSEDITILYNRREFLVRVPDTEIHKYSYWNVKKAVIVAGTEEGNDLELEVVSHDSTLDAAFELDGTEYKGVSYRYNHPLPTNYLHLRITETEFDLPIIPDINTIQIRIEYDYFIHRSSSQIPSDTSFRSPEDVNRVINVTTTSNFSLDYTTDDGLSNYNDAALARVHPLEDVLTRLYTVSGSDISYRLRYIVFFKDEEGRVIGKKESALLFALIIPSCSDIETSYAFHGVYSKMQLKPEVHRFCNWGGGVPCYPDAGTSCYGQPGYNIGDPHNELLISKNCADHGLSLDRNWWPYFSCGAPKYKEPQNFGSIFETVPLPDDAGSWMYKYLVGYNFFRDSIQWGGFFNCFFGVSYQQRNIDAGATSYEETWSGGTWVRAGDMRANVSDGIGTKGVGAWLWGIEQERKVFYIGMDKALNYLDNTTGYVSILGQDSVDGLAYLSEPAGVDLNGVATESFIHPFNQMSSVDIGNMFTNERFYGEDQYRKCPSYWVTGAQNSNSLNLSPPVFNGDGLPIYGEDDAWRWPLIQWWFDNNCNALATDCYGEEVDVPAYKGQQFGDGLQTAWVYLDKIVKPIERTYIQLPSLSLSSIHLEYPDDYQGIVSPPITFENLKGEKYHIVSYRPLEGDHTLHFSRPVYNSDGKIVQHATIWIDNFEPRQVRTDGRFVIDEAPYDSTLAVHSGIDKDTYLAAALEQVYNQAPGQAIRKGLSVRLPINYDTLPYTVYDIVSRGNPSAPPQIANIMSTYEYSVCPWMGLDASPNGSACDLLTNPPFFKVSQGQLTRGVPSNNNVFMDTSDFEILFKLSRMHSSGDWRDLWQPFIESIDIEFFVGDFTDGSLTYRSIMPDVAIEFKTHNGGFVSMGTITDPSETAAGYTTFSLDGIYARAKEIKFIFSTPDSLDSGPVVLSRIKINGRVFSNTMSEQITTYDRKYAPSVMNMDNGSSGINSTTKEPIAGLSHTKGLDCTPTLYQDNYKGDARRFVNFGMQRLKRPILPLRLTYPSGNGTEFFAESAGVMKGARVVADKGRDDFELRTRNGVDASSTTAPLETTFFDGTPGPGEKIQEDMYEYVATNIINNDEAHYNYFMHPDEVNFFTQELAVSPSILPQNHVLSSCEFFVDVPPNLLQFRGDTYENYEGEPWIAQGHSVIQDYTDNCWCWVGNISPHCGAPALGGPPPKCCNRFIVHEHSNSNPAYISDLGHVIRRFTNVLGYAFFLTFSNGLLTHLPELVGQPYATPRNRDIFEDINPQGRNRHIRINGDWQIDRGQPFYYWFQWRFLTYGGYYGPS